MNKIIREYHQTTVRVPVGEHVKVQRVPSLHDVLRAVEVVTQIGMRDLTGPYRRGKIARARHIYCWVARRLSGKSFPMIGYYCGRRDHSTAMHSVGKVDAGRVAFEPELSRVLAVLR